MLAESCTSGICSSVLCAPVCNCNLLQLPDALARRYANSSCTPVCCFVFLQLMLALARPFVLLLVLLCSVSALTSCWLYLHSCVTAMITDVCLVSK